MELRQLRSFILVAELKSFSKAAQILYTTQPSISKIVSSLELELGEKLFERMPHMLELTEFGRSFLPYAQDIVEAENNAMTFLSSKNAPSIFLRMLLPPSVSSLPQMELPLKIHQAIAASHGKNSEIFYSIDVESEMELLTQLREQKCDMALCPILAYGDSTLALNDLNRKPFFPYPHYILYTQQEIEAPDPDYVLRSANAVTSINDNATIDLVSILRAKYQNLAQHRMAHNWHHLLSNVETNCAVGVVPEAMLPLADALGLKHAALSESIYRMDLCILYAKSSPHAELIEAFC